MFASHFIFRVVRNGKNSKACCEKHIKTWHRNLFSRAIIAAEWLWHMSLLRRDRYHSIYSFLFYLCIAVVVTVSCFCPTLNNITPSQYKLWKKGWAQFIKKELVLQRHCFSWGRLCLTYVMCMELGRNTGSFVHPLPCVPMHGWL